MKRFDYSHLMEKHQMSLMELKKAKEAYKKQRIHAIDRGIEFLLTFDEWLAIWISSGHWEERGRGKDKYCMSRIGDLGAYEIGNVFIQPFEQNVRDAHRGKAISEETRQKMIKAQNKLETKTKISAKLTGRTVTTETKDKLSRANKDSMNKPEVKAKISGDNNYQAKLTKEQADSIFSSTLPRKELAEMYGITLSLISRIKNGKHYHVRHK